MNYGEVSAKDLSPAQLIDKLAQGWSSAHSGLALEFIQRWSSHFNTTENTDEIGENSLTFITDFGNIHLRTMDEVPCLLISGKEELKETLSSFWNRWNSPHHLPFILAISDEAHSLAVSTLQNDRCLILSRDQVKRLFRSEDPRLMLKQALWRQIPKRTLIPYNILVPAEGVVFFGRENELARLSDEDNTSFAIAGPGRIGKTSLVRRYRRLRYLKHNSRASQMFYVSFYQCDTGTQGVARFLAMQLDGSRRSSRIESGDLVNFLRYRKQVCRGPLDLTLDEVDEVCHSEAFKYLGEAARLGHCRLILCGRGILLKAILKGNSPLGGRVELVRLSLLGEEAARQLLLKPLADLGFKLELTEAQINDLLSMSGGLPHHIQTYGLRLSEAAIADKTDVISEELVAKVKGDFVLAQFFIKTLEEIKDIPTKLVGLKLLQANQEDVSISFVQELAKQEGISLDRATANDICIDLVINNVLAWGTWNFKLANGGLAFYARETGYLRDTLKEAKQKLLTTTAGQSGERKVQVS